MTPDEATTLRIAALKQYAVDELDKARTDADNARERTLEALGAIRRAIELEDASQPIPYVLNVDDAERVLAVEADLLRSEGINPEWPGFGAAA